MWSLWPILPWTPLLLFYGYVVYKLTWGWPDDPRR